jgi:ketosteroid isomerase-like protein
VVSQQNIEVVRRAYEALSHGDLPDGLLDAQIEYVNPRGAVEPGTRHGLEAFRGAVEKLLEGWESWEMDAEAFEAAGDSVAVLVRYTARGRSSGLEIEGRESALWTLHAGRVIRYEWFHEPADAFESLKARQ